MGCLCGTPEDSNGTAAEAVSKKIDNQLARDKHEYRSTHRLLLLGKSAIFIVLSLDSIHVY